MKKRKLLTALLICTAISLQANAYELSGTFSDYFVDGSKKTNSTNIGGSVSNIAGVGGVLVRGTKATDNYSVLNSVFKNNHAYYDGGAIANYGKNLNVLKSEFIGNTAQLTKDSEDNFTVAVSDSTPLGGGAMALGSESTTVITDTLFQNNISGTNGGAIATRLGEHGNNSAAQLDITGSKFINNTATNNGGAIYNSFYNSSSSQGVNITDNEFTENSAQFGGAVYNAGSKDKVGNSAVLTAINNTFTGNKATVVGGALFNGGNATFTDSTFDNNSAGSAGAVYNSGTFTAQGNTSFTENKVNGSGGAIMNSGTLSLKDNTTFTGNTAVDGGGAIYNDGTATITGNSIFNTNSATVGGAIANLTGGELTVTGATFSENSATNGAGIYNTNAGNVTVTNSTLSGNIASALGGAIANDNANLTVNGGTIITGNEAVYGGGIYNNTLNATDSKVSIADTTFGNNKATVRGGAIYTESDMTISNSDFNNNTATERGGAVMLEKQANVNVIGCSFTANEAGEYGGAISIREAASLNVESSSFTGNKAGIQGGAILQAMKTTGELNVKGSTFEGNEAVAEGGAIWAGAVANIEGSTFKNNKSTGNVLSDPNNYNTDNEGGGAIFVGSSSKTTIAKSDFIGNSSQTVGGAIATRSNATNDGTSTLTVTESNFDGNKAAVNGGAIATYIDATITDTSFTNNTAGSKGGAVWANQDLTVNAVDSNVIMAGNKASEGGDIFMNKEGANLNMNAAEDKSITVASGISGNSYNMIVNAGEGATGSLIINSAIQNAAIDVQNGTFHLAQGSALNNSTLNMASGTTLNTINNQISAFGDNVTLQDNVNLAR